jgi:AcrR family transcriptional regulator
VSRYRDSVARSNVTTLAEEQRGVARARIERAAAAVLRDRGLAATVEEVAAAGGVSVRTVFRHYGTRDHMVVTALRAQLRQYRDTLPRPAPDADLSIWLHDLLVEIHRLNADLGHAYWELAAMGDSLEGEFAELAAVRRRARTKLVNSVTAAAWRLAGRDGRPPRWLVDAFAIHLSSFATRALVADFGRSPDDVAEASTRALIAAIAAA